MRSVRRSKINPQVLRGKPGEAEDWPGIWTQNGGSATETFRFLLLSVFLGLSWFPASAALRTPGPTQSSAAVIMQQICLHHISSLLRRENINHWSASSSLPPLFLLLLLSRSEMCKQDFSEIDPSGAQHHKHAALLKLCGNTQEVDIIMGTPVQSDATRCCCPAIRAAIVWPDPELRWYRTNTNNSLWLFCSYETSILW